MAKKAKVAEQSLDSILWNCRNDLRGTVGGNEKKRDAVMGLVFLKFAGDKFEKRRAEIHAEHGDIPAFLEKESCYRAKDYSRAPSKYIAFIDHDLEIDYATEMKRIQKEMRDLLKAEKQS